MNLYEQIRYLPAMMASRPNWTRGQCWLILQIAKADQTKLKALREVAEDLKQDPEDGLGDWMLTFLDMPADARAYFARWAWVIAPRPFWAIKVAGFALWLKGLSDLVLKKARDIQDDYADPAAGAVAQAQEGDAAEAA